MATLISEGDVMSRVLIAATALVAFMGNAVGADRSEPSLGLLYSAAENSSLQYRCFRSEGVLTCDFVQTSVRRGANPEDEAKAIERGKAIHKDQKPLSAAQCAGIEELRDVLTGKKPAPNGKPTATLSDVEKRDSLASTEALLAYCVKPSEEAAINITLLEHDKAKRTCRVSSNPYTQSFKRIVNQEKNTWVVAQDGPDGVCGFVNLSRFESEESSGLFFWNYVARRATTNPTGKLLGASCAEFEETEFSYSWRSKGAIFAGCDYIEFSAM